MNLTYKPIQAGDVEIIYRYAKQTILRYEDPNIMDLHKALQWTRTSIEANTSSYVKVCDDDIVVAYYHIYENMDFTYELTNFYVVEGKRNQGYGKAIMQHILESVDDTLYLYVFVANERAIHLYESNGFKLHKRVSPTRMIMKYVPA